VGSTSNVMQTSISKSSRRARSWRDLSIEAFQAPDSFSWWDATPRVIEQEIFPLDVFLSKP
jgi:hypothetical protein